MESGIPLKQKRCFKLIFCAKAHRNCSSALSMCITHQKCVTDLLLPWYRHYMWQVSVYGFGGVSSSIRLGGKTVPYQYYKLGGTERIMGASVHSFEVERRLLQSLSFEGHLQVCNELSQDDCGLRTATESWEQNAGVFVLNLANIARILMFDPWYYLVQFGLLPKFALHAPLWCTV